jgi:hypothetical protein
MHPVIALLVLTVGQCAGGQCPSPTSGMSFAQPAYSRPSFLQPEIIQYEQPVIREVPLQLDWHWTKYKGLVFPVWGSRLANGTIQWDDRKAFNQAQYYKALAAAVRVVETPMERASAQKDDKAVPLAAAKPPEQAQPPKVPVPPPQLFGVTRSELGKVVGYSGNTREAYFAPQDKVFLTVIGNQEDRKEVEDDWRKNPEFADLRDKVSFGAYNRGDWQVADNLGYAGNGKPTILIQQASGRVNWRAYDYSGGAKGLSQALRRADPAYHPERDPGPNSGPLPTSGHEVEIIVAIVLFAVALAVIPRREK